MTVKNALLTSEFRKVKKVKSTKKATETMDLTILRLILLSLQGMVRRSFWPVAFSFASLMKTKTSQKSFAQDASEAIFFADSSSSSSDYQPIKFLSTDKHGKTQKIKQCCGQYPKRFPYVVGGNHECCNRGFMEVLKPVGTCWIIF